MLDRLPLEILRLIGECLDEVHPESVIDLACVNKHCFSVIATILYRTLKFPIGGSAQLAEDVHHYSRLLQFIDGYGSVRRIIIESRNPGEVFEKIERHTEPDRGNQWCRPKLSTIENKGCDQEIIEDYIESTYREDSTFLVPLKEVYRTNHLWKPLAEFIRQIPSLQSLFYESYSQFPPCLLETIHRYQPQCKLYLTNFHLLSLNALGTADEHEFAILSSPCLRGIGTEFVQVGEHDDHGKISFFSEALNCLVGGVTPNLKTLFMIRLRPAHHWHNRDPRPPWAGFTQQFGNESGQPKSRGSLEYLWISDWYQGAIESLKEATDFSVLKVLRFKRAMDEETFEYLATKCEFSSLTELELKLEIVYPDHWRPSPYISAVSSFLSRIPALLNFKLHAWNPEMTTSPIFEHLGSTLCQLTLLPAVNEKLSLQDLQGITQNCPYLEELTITISRSRGDAQKCAKYKALGSLPRLQHLHLRLDPSDLHARQEEGIENDNDMAKRIVMPSHPSFNDYDQQICNELSYEANRFCRVPRKGHIRDAFINGALNCDLAISIWETISMEKSLPGRSHKPNVTALPLISMEVEVSPKSPYYLHLEGSKLGTKRLVRVLFDLLGDVHVKRTVGPGGNIEIEAKSEATNINNKPMDPWLEEIYRRLWPKKCENWWEDWHSFPLAVSAEDEIDWKSR